MLRIVDCSLVSGPNERLVIHPSGHLVRIAEDATSHALSQKASHAVDVRGSAAIFGSAPVAQREDHCEPGERCLVRVARGVQERGIEIAVLVEP